MIEQDKIQEIIDKTDIVSLASEFVSLRKAGSDYKGLCPFHEEKTGSFMVSPSKKIAKCFGCGGGGNPIKFLMSIKHIKFEEACIELAARAGVELNIKKKSGPDYSKYYQIMSDAADFYHFSLLHTKLGLEALKYLENRGITKEIIEEFNIGLAPDKIDTLYLNLKDAKYTDLDLLDCGLIKKSENNDGFYDIFRKRITFPITDIKGNVIAFSARIFCSEEDTAKYINSPETIIFKKNLSLYHIDKALPYIVKRNRVILHEGQLDVIASTKSGLGEAVCSMGTALTINQVKLLHNQTDNIIICYDGDKAGINAMMKAIKLIKNEGNINLSLVRLPGGLDPDEYVQKYGSENYKEYFESHLESPNDFIYSYITLGKDLTKLDVIEEIKTSLFRFFDMLKSNTLIEGYLKRFSASSGISETSLMLDYNNYHKTQTSKDSITSQNDIRNNSNETVNIPKYVYKNDAYSFLGYTENEWNNLLFRQRAELRLFNYARKSKSLALRIDQKSENGKPLYMCFDKIHQELWDELINTYYNVYDTYNEGTFLSMLGDDRYYNCIISDKMTLFNLKDSEVYNSRDLEECVNAIFYSSDLPTKSDFKNKSSEEQLQELENMIDKLKRINKRRIDSKK